jgi:hypothetical protein
MRVIVAGDRDWCALDLAEAVVGQLLFQRGPDLVIVQGGATGIDRSFAEACIKLGVEQEAHSARWDDLDAPGAVIRHDKEGHSYYASAGPAKNVEMLAAGADQRLTFHRLLARSRGTKDCVRRAIEPRIPTYLIDSEEAWPRRLRGMMRG